MDTGLGNVWLLLSSFQAGVRWGLCGNLLNILKILLPALLSFWADYKDVYFRRVAFPGAKNRQGICSVQ